MRSKSGDPAAAQRTVGVIRRGKRFTSMGSTKNQRGHIVIVEEMKLMPAGVLGHQDEATRNPRLRVSRNEMVTTTEVENLLVDSGKQ